VRAFRIVVLTAASAAGVAAIQTVQTPVVLHAASQSETPPAKQQTAPPDPGAAVYAKRCAVCHGVDRQGSLPAFPPLAGISHKLSNEQIAAIVHGGKGRMPGFASLQGANLDNLLHFLSAAPAAAAAAPAGDSRPSALATSGEALFHQNCAFCHGRDAMGGETGPDLTQSKLVLGDKNGDKTAAVIHDGRPNTKMAGFNFTNPEMASLIAFIQSRVKAAEAHQGGRRGVVAEDLQTGDAAAGKAYFNGAGGCSKCHSPTGDLAGIAGRFRGLELEKRMLYPENARSQVTVTTGPAQTVSGVLAYRDEFTIGLRDSNGTYRSWPARSVKYTVKSLADAHADQLPKYSDDDVHNLMKYLQTLQ
jgi:mono/diheme cytochrome c family protein